MHMVLLFFPVYLKVKDQFSNLLGLTCFCLLIVASNGNILKVCFPLSFTDKDPIQLLEASVEGESELFSRHFTQVRHRIPQFRLESVSAVKKKCNLI